MITTGINELIARKETARALASLYEQTAKHIVAELVAGVSKGEAFRVEATLSRIHGLLRELDPSADSRLSRWIKTQLPNAYVVGDASATRQLRNLLGSKAFIGRAPGVRDAFTVVNQSAMKGVMAAMEATMGKAKLEMERLLGTVVRQTKTTLEAASKIRTATASGFLRGATTRQIADDIASTLLGRSLSLEARQRLRATGFTGEMFNTFEAVARGKIIKVGKRNYSARSYADLVARTQMREISKVATLTRLGQNGVFHVQILAHSQDGAIDLCTAYFNKVFFIGVGSDPAGFPSLRSTPNGGWPWHPNCECNGRPYVLPLKSERQLEDDRQAAALLPPQVFGTSTSQVNGFLEDLEEGDLQRIGIPVKGTA